MNNVGDKWWSVPIHFIAKLLTGTLLFFVIAALSASINLFVIWLEQQHVSKWHVLGFTYAEYLLLSIDLLLFTKFIFVTARQTWEDLK